MSHRFVNLQAELRNVEDDVELPFRTLIGMMQRQSDLSQRLQQLASAGETVLSEATVKALASPVDVLPLPAQMVKGRDTPVVAFKLITPGPVAGPVTGGD